MFHVRPYSRLSALPQEAASISAPQKNADPFRTPAGSFMWNTSMLRTFVSLVDRIIDMNSSAVCTGHCLKCISLIPAE